jgi:arylsulfatase
VLPTLLDFAGLEAPGVVGGTLQMDLDGVTLRGMLDDPVAPDPRTSQYYECWGSRAMYEDGWKVVTDHVNQLTHADRELIAGSDDFHHDHWHLFDTRADLAENHDLADEHPDVRDRLVARWHEEAQRNGVLPLSDGVADRLAHFFLPWPTGARRVELLAGERAFEDNVPLMAHGFTATAHLGTPLAVGTVGVLAEQGDYNGGWVWFVLDGELTFACSFVSEYLTRLAVPLPVGATKLQLVGRRAGGGFDVACAADGTLLGQARLDHEWPGLWTPNSAASLLAGCGRPLPVCDGYDPTVPFSGAFGRLVIVADLGASYDDLAHQVETAFRSQ